MIETILYVLYGVLVLALGVGVWKLRAGLKRFRITTIMTPAQMIETHPSVTVCIPARNERHALTDCLDGVIKSNYPKLEVIVLDDVSHDDTSALIKSYASEGVRFVEGSALPEGWLGKNHALQKLLEEASGTYVLFMDVDTRLAPDAIEQLVAYAQQEGAQMVSVLPRREDGWRASVLFSTLRYFWEIMFDRREAPATASNAWLIHRQTLLQRWGGFEPFKAAIQPESRFSTELLREGAYRFVVGTAALGVSYEKKWRSQLSTSVRLLYPLLGGRWSHAVIAVLDLLIFASPLYIILAGFAWGWGPQQFIAAALWLAIGIVYGWYARAVWLRGWAIAVLIWPFIVLQEAVLVAVSAERYHRRAVTWKGRVVKAPKL
jgi:glycosyltransferase involved in cell wall biosynthesis